MTKETRMHAAETRVLANETRVLSNEICMRAQETCYICHCVFLRVCAHTKHVQVADHIYFEES